MSRIKTVPKDQYILFEEKAGEFHDMMEEAYIQSKYSPCVSMAVHCAISAADALAVRNLGRKSSAQNHAESFSLLKEVKTSDEAEKSRICDRLYELAEMKTVAEYEGRKMSKADAEKARNLCSKIYSFIKSELAKSKV